MQVKRINTKLNILKKRLVTKEVTSILKSDSGAKINKVFSEFDFLIEFLMPLFKFLVVTG
jgi:hypothetical protein